ncbi:MAG: hypothetical protein M3Y41_00475 [Pseudomonadota bacterium]|nr:hypothetical protein [Pseudomonadota bacterium]
MLEHGRLWAHEGRSASNQQRGSAHGMARTDDAERVVAHFAQGPLLVENVYLSPLFLSGSQQKELADHLLIHRGQAIVLQLKCQADPGLRIGSTLTRWVTKSASDGVNQLTGALRTIRGKAYWCNHPVFGRVEFQKDQISAIHGVVLVEHRHPGFILPTDSRFPIKIRDALVSYFTLSDFCNTIEQLRTFRDIVQYLDSRHNACGVDLRRTGDDEAVPSRFVLKLR